MSASATQGGHKQHFASSCRLRGATGNALCFINALDDRESSWN